MDGKSKVLEMQSKLIKMSRSLRRNSTSGYSKIVTDWYALSLSWTCLHLYPPPCFSRTRFSRWSRSVPCPSLLPPGAFSLSFFFLNCKSPLFASRTCLLSSGHAAQLAHFLQGVHFFFLCGFLNKLLLYMYTHTHTHIHIYTYTHTYTHIYTHTYIHTYLSISMDIRISRYISIDIGI